MATIPSMSTGTYWCSTTTVFFSANPACSIHLETSAPRTAIGKQSYQRHRRGRLCRRVPSVVVAAHLDDETFAAGGLIHCACAGSEVAVITVTDGEGARIMILGQPGNAIRRRELRRCAQLPVRSLISSGIAWEMPMSNAACTRPCSKARSKRGCWPMRRLLIAPARYTTGTPDHESVARVFSATCSANAATSACSVIRSGPGTT